MHKCEHCPALGHLEGSKYWFSVPTELQNRSVKDLSIACIDELSG